ncbi:MAG: hypothetical protein JNM90_04760 [Burkholderiales bacterium]|nr:hypothetical protein [Burkholderiales bacterium]
MSSQTTDLALSRTAGELMPLRIDAAARRAADRLAQSRSSVIGIFTLVLLAILWGGILAQIGAEREAVAEAARRDNANLARALAEQSLRGIKGADHIAMFVKRQLEAADRRLDVGEFARGGLLDGQLAREIAHIDETGVLRSGSIGPMAATAWADSEHFRAHALRDRGALHVGKPAAGRDPATWRVQLSRRVNKPDGAFGGIVLVGIDPQCFSTNYADIELGAGGVAALLGTDGVVRAGHGWQALSVGQDLSGSVLDTHLQVGDAGSLRAATAGEAVARHLSYRKLAGYPLAVVVGRTDAEVFAQMRSRELRYLLWAAGASLALLLLAAVAACLARGLNAPARDAGTGE